MGGRASGRGVAPLAVKLEGEAGGASGALSSRPLGRICAHRGRPCSLVVMALKVETLGSS